MDEIDVIVVGGGPAGMAAAVTLGRVRRDVLLLDAGEGRNASAEAVHNLLVLDGVAPAELRRRGREQLAQYATVAVRDAGVEDAKADGDGFRVTIDGGEQVRARRLLLATGLRDELPAIPGLAERWGRSVIHCPFCHGYEFRDVPLAVLGGRPEAVRFALWMRRFSNDVALCTDGPVELDQAARDLLARHGVAVREERVVGLEGAGDRLERVLLEGAEPLPRTALYAHSVARQRSDLAERLGCALLEDGAVRVDDVGRTSVPGVAAAGDMARRPTVPMPMAAVAVASASGLLAATALEQDLLTEDLGRG